MIAQDSGLGKLMMANYQVTSSVMRGEHKAELDRSPCHEATSSANQTGLVVAMCCGLEFVQIHEDNAKIPG